MLVLTRKPGESIFVGPAITVTFIGFDSRGQARIGIAAPPAVEIARAELADQKEVRP